MSLPCIAQASPTTTTTTCEGEGLVSLPVFLRRMGVSRSLGMDVLCTTGLCWVEDSRVRLMRHHEKAGLGRRLYNAQGYPFDLLSRKGVVYAQRRWPECLAEVEGWYRRQKAGRIGRAVESLRRGLPHGSPSEGVALLKKEHPELTHKEIAEVLGVSSDTVKRCVAAERKRSWDAGSAASIKALGGGKMNSPSPQGGEAEEVLPVAGITHQKTSSHPGMSYDPAEESVHDTHPDGRPSVIEGFPFDFGAALKESTERHAARMQEPAPLRPSSPRYDAIHPMLFPPQPQATGEEAWQALETFRVWRRGNTCTAMEVRFVLDHFPTVPAEAVAVMVGVEVATVRRSIPKFRGVVAVAANAPAIFGGNF